MSSDQKAFERLLNELFPDHGVSEPPAGAEGGYPTPGQVLVERADWLSRPEITVGFDGRNRYFSLGISSTSKILWDEGLVVRVQDETLDVPPWITDVAVLDTASSYALDLAKTAVGEQAWATSDELVQGSHEEAVVSLTPDQAQDLSAVWRKAARTLQLETQPLPGGVLDDAALALITDRWTRLHTVPSRHELVAARAQVEGKGEGSLFEWELDDESVARDLAGSRYSPRNLWPLLSISADDGCAVVRLSRLKGPVDRNLRVFVRLGEEQSVLLRPEVKDGEHILIAKVPLGGAALEMSSRPPVETFRY